MANTVAILFAVLALYRFLWDLRLNKYRLHGRSRLRSSLSATLTGSLLLVLIVQLNARIAANAEPLVAGPAAPFEWAGYTLAALAWAMLLALFIVGRDHFCIGTPSWYWRFPPVLILAANFAKLRFVLDSEERSDYFAGIFYLYIGLQVLLCLLVVFFPPEKSDLELVHHGLEPSSPRAEYMELSSEEGGRVCPEVDANILSRLTFSWMGPLMREGYREPLTFDKMWTLPPGDRSAVLDARFLRLWAAERLKNPDHPSLIRVLWQATAQLFLLAIPCKMLSDAAQFTAPVFMGLLLNAVSAGKSDTVGYSLAFGMLAGLLVGTLADNQQFQLSMRAGFQLRSMLTDAVYHKILFLTPDARAQFSSGRLYSAIGSDVDTIQNLCQGILNFISSPLRIIAALVLLYFQLGVAAFAAVAILVLLMPIQAWLVGKQRGILRQSLTATDERAKLESELFGGVEVVKCYVWEGSFMDRIRRVRGTELGMIWRAFMIASVNTVLMLAVPAAAAVGAFGTYSLWTHQPLTPAQAFTSLSLLAVMRFPIAALPQLVASAVQASVAVGRLQAILAAPEQGALELLPAPGPGVPALTLHGDYGWSRESAPCLRGVGLDLAAGSLVAVVGPTGSGKSALLAAALGLMEQASGPAPRLRGRVALVPQTAFITQGTLRDNVLFGAEYEPRRYAAAMAAAALEPDLEQLAAGDATELGERGVTVSGGQKQRIALARAVYADADVVLLDDPLSALDARVGRQVFRDCVQGALAGKTRVLVTNQLQYVNAADRILLIQEGVVVEDGTYEELMAAGGAFVGFMSRAEAEAAEEDEEQDLDDLDVIGEGDRKNSDMHAKSPRKGVHSRGNGPGGTGPAGTAASDVPGARLVEEEGRSKGGVSWKVMRSYLDAMGGLFLVGVLAALFALVECARVAAQLWLQFWTDEVDKTHGETSKPIGWYLGIYAALSLSQVLFTAGSQFLSRSMSLHASTTMHEDMVGSLIRAPMSFFNTTPLGRIVNRLTKDTSELDKNLTDFTAFFIRSLFTLTSTIVLVGALNPFTLWALTPILFGFGLLYRYFQTTVREVKRLDAVSRSPIYTAVGEALGGLATIRAFRCERRLLRATGAALDSNVVMSLANQSANRWLSVRLETLGALAATAAALAAVEQRGAAALLGNILSSALQVSALTNMTLRSASLAEVSFNSAERVLEYSHPPQEAAALVPGSVPRGWPGAGAVRFQDVEMRYRPGLPLVLRGLTFSVPGGTTCGVVGRTGAGKSSLVAALFRLVELERGSISIDGVPTASMGLDQLRGGLALIPQLPVLFTGTVRFNLSPWGQHSDAACWAALRQAHLAHVISANPLGLDAVLAEGGAPLSAGQRQLLALARALLRGSRVLVLDEATANVDVETDALIQDTVRTEFSDRTVIAVAHRLHTVIDAGTVLVMDAGRAVEQGSAAQLLRDANGVFTDMVRETGAASERLLRNLATAAAAAEEDGQEVGMDAEKQAEETPPSTAAPASVKLDGDKKQLPAAATTTTGKLPPDSSTSKPGEEQHQQQIHAAAPTLTSQRSARRDGLAALLEEVAHREGSADAAFLLRHLRSAGSASSAGRGGWPGTASTDGGAGGASQNALARRESMRSATPPASPVAAMRLQSREVAAAAEAAAEEVRRALEWIGAMPVPRDIDDEQQRDQPLQQQQPGAELCVQQEDARAVLAALGRASDLVSRVADLARRAHKDLQRLDSRGPGAGGRPAHDADRDWMNLAELGSTPGWNQ